MYATACKFRFVYSVHPCCSSYIVSVFFLHSSKVFHYSTIVLRYFHSYRCYAHKLPDQQGTLDSEMDGNHNVFYLKSPGTDSHYPSKRLSYYHIKCNDGSRFEIKFFHLNRFSLQDKVRTSYNQRKCVDYVKITDLNNPNKNEEFCGTLKAHSGSRLGTNTYSNNVLVTFRSSKYNNNYKGFWIQARCLERSHSMENCLKVEEVENSEYAAGQTVDKWTKVSESIQRLIFYGHHLLL